MCVAWRLPVYALLDARSAVCLRSGDAAVTVCWWCGGFGDGGRPLRGAADELGIRVQLLLRLDRAWGIAMSRSKLD